MAAVSLYMPGARVQAADIIWRKRARRLIIGLQRCDWEQAASAEAAEAGAAQGASEAAKRAETEALSPPPAAIPAVPDFAHVSAVRAFGFDKSAAARAERLQGLVFRPSQPPGGVIEFLFAGGKAGLQCEVECIELRPEDLPPEG